VTGRPPALDLERERRLHRLLIEAARSDLLESAHDCAEGGIAIALAESAIAGGVGFAVTLPGDQPGHVGLFSESASRAVVSVAPERATELEDAAAEGGVSFTRLGETGGPAVAFDGLFEMTVAEIAPCTRTRSPSSSPGERPGRRADPVLASAGGCRGSEGGVRRLRRVGARRRRREVDLLRALRQQHRGQEAAGMAVSDGEHILVFKELGLVSQVFDEATLSTLRGDLGIGHNRYSTTGSTTWENAQPAFKTDGQRSLALGHNGNLVNTLELASGSAPGARPRPTRTWSRRSLPGIHRRTSSRR
jgi:hypothetical protein